MRKKAKEKKLERRIAQKRLNAKKPASQSPLFMEVPVAMRYLRAAEVGRTPNESSVSIQVEVLGERGTAPLQGAVRFAKPLKETRILCLSLTPEKREEALKAGAVAANDVSFINDISSGKAVDLNYDKIIATPDIEPMLRKVGRVLGPKGLMPAAKRGTVTENVGEMISNTLGTQPFRERNGRVALTVARCDFRDEDVMRNIISASKAIRQAIASAKAKKPIILGNTVLSSTHGPGIVIAF
ncbi:mitochondrial ribosomal protein of the large subunit [Brettanomyces bruxellensis AWRI1499]|nr:mitochondrial ribosomal protein of the large subunit [Brettanomyces bruxellensis AWRI1499]